MKSMTTNVCLLFFITTVSSWKRIWNQCSHFRVTKFWAIRFVRWFSFHSVMSLFFFFSFAALRLASSSFVRCKALMNAWQLTKSVHNHINKTISLFSSLCFALRVCYVLVTTIATNSLVECLWFGRILLLFQRSDHNTQNEETKKHSCIEMQTKLRGSLSLFFCLARLSIVHDKNINFVINLHVNQIIDWVQDCSIKLEYQSIRGGLVQMCLFSI